MKLKNAYVQTIHSDKKKKDYIKAVLFCSDDRNDDTKIYSSFTEYSDYVFDLFTAENINVDIFDINYKSALLVYDVNKRLILNRIF